MSGEHSLLDYKCQPFLPKDIRSKSLLPNPRRIFRSEGWAELSTSYYPYPETELYEVLKNCCYPDPPDFHIARFNDWIYTVDPGLFPEGGLKSSITERTNLFLKDRDRIIKSHCKQNKLDPSDFTPLKVESREKLTFRNCGPRTCPIDSFDRWCRAVDPLMYFRILFYECGIFAFAIMLWLNMFVGAGLLIVFFIATELLIECFTCSGYARGARQQPIIQPMFDVDLNWLMREIREFRTHRFNREADMLNIPELRDAFTQFQKRRYKDAYIIKIQTEVPLSPPRWLPFFRSKELTLTIEILGQYLKATPIVVAWYDAPTSLLFAFKAKKIIQHHKEELCRLFCARLDMRSYSISVTENSGRPGKPDERHYWQYWPTLRNRYHLDMKLLPLPNQIYKTDKKDG